MLNTLQQLLIQFFTPHRYTLGMLNKKIQATPQTPIITVSPI